MPPRACLPLTAPHLAPRATTALLVLRRRRPAPQEGTGTPRACKQQTARGCATRVGTAPPRTTPLRHAMAPAPLASTDPPPASLPLTAAARALRATIALLAPSAPLRRFVRTATSARAARGLPQSAPAGRSTPARATPASPLAKRARWAQFLPRARKAAQRAPLARSKRVRAAPIARVAVPRAFIAPRGARWTRNTPAPRAPGGATPMPSLFPRAPAGAVALWDFTAPRAPLRSFLAPRAAWARARATAPLRAGAFALPAPTAL